jgi:hypothetical protein
MTLTPWKFRLLIDDALLVEKTVPTDPIERPVDFSDATGAPTRGEPVSGLFF